MMTNEQLNCLSEQEHHLWIDSLDEDESAVLYSSIGHRYTLVFISLVKRLLAGDLPADYRLKFLEWLDKTHGERTWCSAPIIAAIEPMCGDAYQLLRETMKLGPRKYLHVIASWEVFNAFVALNPSLLMAIKMAPGYQTPSPQRARSLEATQLV